MNDRFLFRGKITREFDRLDLGRDWIFGSYIPNYTRSDGEAAPSIYYNDGLRGMIEVDPATVGQCTYSRDKNDKLIFEGDIVKFESYAGGTALLDIRKYGTA